MATASGIFGNLNRQDRTALVAGVLGLYVFFSFQYWLVLWITSGGQRNAWQEALIDYFLLKALLTIPVAWLFFRLLHAAPLSVKLLTHLATGTLWVFCWFYLYRFVQQARGGYYLQGNAVWWDVYIPGLFYCIQFCLFHLYEFYFSLKSQRELRFQLAETALQTEIRLLKSQMQPHFLFNTLNSISASVPPNLEHIREMIASLADIFRYSLNASKSDYVEVRKELVFIQDFLALEQMRYGERLKISYDIEERTHGSLIPPMLVQPLIENALRHGISGSLHGGEIRISMHLTGTFITVAVADTGNPFTASKTLDASEYGTGLYNTDRRLQLLFDEKLEIHPIQPHGTMVTFKIPLTRRP